MRYSKLGTVAELLVLIYFTVTCGRMWNTLLALLYLVEINNNQWYNGVLRWGQREGCPRNFVGLLCNGAADM